VRFFFVQRSVFARLPFLSLEEAVRVDILHFKVGCILIGFPRNRDGGGFLSLSLPYEKSHSTQQGFLKVFPFAQLKVSLPRRILEDASSR